MCKGQTAATRARRSALREQERRLTVGYAQGEISLDAYRSSVAPIREQLAACEHALTADPNPNERLAKLARVLEIAESLWTLHSRLPGRAQTQLLRLVFKAISLNPAGVVSYTLNPPFSGLLTEDGAGHGPTPRAGAPHLDLNQRRTANIDIFEFDDQPLQELLTATIKRKAA